MVRSVRGIIKLICSTGEVHSSAIFLLYELTAVN